MTRIDICVVCAICVTTKLITNIKNLTIMGLDLSAIRAAAAKMKQEQEQPQAQAQTKTQTKTKTAEPKGGAKANTKTSAPKTDTPKTKGGAKYVIPAEFKQAIEDHLKGRADMKEKLSKKGKSIDGCCDYIFDVMRKRAEKNRGGKSAVGLYSNPDEIFGLAVHYYDETDEALKAEK
jgi:hypothetical protein